MPLDPALRLPARVRPLVAAMPMQQIAAVSAHGADVADVVKLWYGESDVASPAQAVATASAALAAGETLYPPKNGLPVLQQAIADYLSALRGRPFARDEITVATGGMGIIKVIGDLLLDAGDNAVLVTPLWPNAEAVVRLRGAEPRPVPLTADADGRWHLDLDRLADAIDARTRLLFVNSPNNPTGWMASRAELEALLGLARRHGLWLVADEVYDRIVYTPDAAGVFKAPSILDIAGPEDPVMAVNSVSKTWAMTGWRVGWVAAPAGLSKLLGNLIEYATSGVAPFVQLGAAAVVRDGESFARQFRDYCAAGRTRTAEVLGSLPRVRYASPEAAFYAFFAVDGLTDALDFAKRLVTEAKVGVAPGTAFDPACGGWLRLCFAQSAGTLEKGLDRLSRALR